VDRDRQVARFRDPDGPPILICTEVGGEGRNFQFSHHLINYDLPWSPATMEQRIGRLDRIGQSKPVEIHVFDLEGTLSSDVLSLLADAVGVFEETVGGLDAVLEEVEPRLTELALLSPDQRVAYARELQHRVRAARAQVKRAYDPLLDLRSFDRAEVTALAERAQRRLNIEEEAGEGGLEDALWAIARDLDERLEETVTELARRVGIGVDTDEQVDPFHCAFHFGHALKVEALPGLDISEEKTVLGTFWRDTAVEREEIDYFATGHPIVEALFGFLRDAPYGRNAFRFVEKRGPLRAKGLEVLFHVIPPEPQDTSPGARVPSRHLSRFVERWLLHIAVVAGADGAPKVDTSILPALEKPGRSLRGDEIRAAFPGFAAFVDRAMPLAAQAAEAELEHVSMRARRAIEAERDRTLDRMRLSLVHQGLPHQAVDAQLQAEVAHHERLLAALSGLKIAPDSVAGFVLNR
jgi:ATP-dependent helicase HepA